jgi:hypothetical protein
VRRQERLRRSHLGGSRASAVLQPLSPLLGTHGTRSPGAFPVSFGETPNDPRRAVVGRKVIEAFSAG